MNEVKSSLIIEINLSETLMNGILGGGGGRGFKQKLNKVITAAAAATSIPSHHLEIKSDRSGCCVRGDKRCCN